MFAWFSWFKEAKFDLFKNEYPIIAAQSEFSTHGEPYAIWTLYVI